MRHGPFRLRWTRRSSSRPSIEAHSVVRGLVVRHGCVVNVVYHNGVHVRHARVVVVLLSSPIPTVKAGAGIAESVANPTIKSDRRPPVTGIPDVEAVHKRPISRCPKYSDFRREDPSPGNPVVASVVIIGPIARRPDVAGPGTNRLCVDGQEGWAYSHSDRNTYICCWCRICCCVWGKDQEGNTQHQRTNQIGDPHNTHLSGVGWAFSVFCAARRLGPYTI
jgi:hypothetical protein